MTPLKVLIVDDDPAVRGLIRSLLETHSEVEECGSAAGALEAFERVRPDWTLMDLQLGESSGFDVTRAILAAHPEARIVIVTQHDGEVLRAAAAAAGAVGYLLKDDLTELPRLIRRV